jgi:hypothetical protein
VQFNTLTVFPSSQIVSQTRSVLSNGRQSMYMLMNLSEVEIHAA